ncbi:hypothetical protein pRL80078 (plasmid) [Rhizobium johnstonii 3841]|uniref:Uncharacterized protein n=1 Tax=Rhizobium johnstonii (strain DSM 114642 / LMG 32736 / 3841) TaxID=216596 RepID=Q1M9D9_RHIJ3|nr:hypothetical protein CHR56_38885 [Rhizobium leguminosarum bv. viciae]CAK02879.1 hypothetical protein pRL80078 [Rhizobium johnstonii 3841]
MPRFYSNQEVTRHHDFSDATDADLAIYRGEISSVVQLLIAPTIASLAIGNRHAFWVSAATRSQASPGTKN